ncbi:MAG: FKBP-type peptidyl-prolyl cis-trans isomerase [Sphingobacteriales bacterium]
MKKYLLIVTLFIVALSSCKKDDFDPAKQAITDDNAIQAYIKANNITAVQDKSGLYYSVVTPGTGDYPNANSTITINSTGKLLNGTVFDVETGLPIALSSVIKGWQIGIPHINTGGRILLLVPSALGYGNAPNGSIPKNSVLIFTIDLLGFSN